MDQHIFKNMLFSNTLKERIKRIQNGQEEIDRFVSEYESFILSTARKCTGKSYITVSDDEYSVALIAFVEAIRAYREEKGKFLSFAKNIMKMRLIDNYRKEKRHMNAISIEGNFEEETENDLTSKESLERYENDEIAEKRSLEFSQFKEELANWDITLLDLVHTSPKQIKTRQMCKDVIRYLMADEEKLKYIFEKQILPLAEIQKDTGIPRKQLERVRKYIIAVLIIQKGDYQFLSDYVADWRCGK